MKYKLVVTDFDGTLWNVESSSWYAITSALGCEKEDNINRKLFYQGKIDYAEWSRRTIELYKKYGLTKKKFLHIISSYKLVDSCVETFRKLRKMGIKTGIISGGIKNVYEFLRRKEGLEVDFPKFASELFFDENGNLIYGTYSNFDFEGKIDVLEEICKESGINLEEVVFVGDDENDLPIFEVVGLSVAINPKSQKVKENSDVVISHFSELLKLVG